MKANREYKDSVFTALFKDKRNLLELYSAISGADVPPDTEIEMATLEDVLFNDRKNDIAFVMGGKIVVLIEHQASINENMPLRLLIYIASVYEKLIDNDSVYKENLLAIPKPDFIVLYNGAKPFPDEKTLCLSDAYGGLGMPGLGGWLELEVRVVNINEGRNGDIVKKCGALYGYARFVGKVRANLRSGSKLEDAVARAVRDCMDEGVLAGFLKSHSSEVVNMLTTEWNLERAKVVWKQEAREAGLAEGREEGREQGLEEGRGQGLEQGLEISTRIILALKERTPVEEIAERYNLPVSTVKQIQSAFAEYSQRGD